MSELLIAGFQAIRAELMHNPERVLELHVSRQREDERVQSLIDAAEQFGIHVARIKPPPRESREKAQPVLARIKLPPRLHERDIPALLTEQASPLILALDQVQDARNFGACLRVADGAAVSFVLVPISRSAPLSAYAYQTACGALASLKLVWVDSLRRALEQLHEAGLQILGTTDHTDHLLYEFNLKRPSVVVMGGEAKGLRPSILKSCDSLARLPMGGACESLNVSVATGICLYEAVRQRT